MDQAASALTDLQGLHLEQLCTQTEIPPSKQISDIGIIQAALYQIKDMATERAAKGNLSFCVANCIFTSFLSLLQLLVLMPASSEKLWWHKHI